MRAVAAGIAAVSLVIAAVFLARAPQEKRSPRPRTFEPRLETGSPPTSAEASPAPAAGKTLSVYGRVLGLGRMPVPGAVVDVFSESGIVGTGRTGEDGTFEVPRAAGWFDVVVRDPASGTTRRCHCEAGPEEERIDLGDLLLVATRGLEVTVVARGAPVPHAQVLIAFEDGVSRFVEARARTDENGRAVIDGLTKGLLAAYAAAPGYGRGQAWVPLESDAVTVALPEERILRVEVREKESGAPLRAIRLTLLEARLGEAVLIADPEPTDDEGTTLVRGLAPDTALRLLPLSHHPPPRGHETVRVDPSASRVTVVLPAPRSVRWPILEEGDAGRPPQGAVRLGTYEGRVEGSWLLADGLPEWPIQLLAVAGDGSVARVWADRGTAEGKPVSFFLPRTIRVTVRDTDGRPVPDVGIGAGSAYPVSGHKLTDDHGRVELTGLYPDKSTLVECLPFPPSRDGARRLATVRPGAVVRDLDVVLPKERAVVLDVFKDGRPGLPTSCLVRGPGLLSTPVSEDPVRGEIRLRWRPLSEHQTLLVTMISGGYEKVVIDATSGRAQVSLAR